ncbi:MAG: tRNA (adenosine(37)-N6)-dimethylallyltransferase MiaA [Candidatus Spechtbacteria bacterium]|nr:tRNA (adenosine(37)-N6)-dimethylallyltransferase MiaA [Candidatus Spechtbacteria bacterium]
MIPLIVIVGPTASGKSDLAVTLAKKFNGEIISADSRQVYRGMDIGTGKITKKEMKGVPHYILDVADPKRQFTVVQYRKQAIKAIHDISKRNKIPFLVGGTGFYIQSVVDNPTIPNVPPDKKLRAELEKKSLGNLMAMLNGRDPARAKTIDQKNKRRVIRALEIVLKSGRPVPHLTSSPPKDFSLLIIGIKKDYDELKEKIHKRLVTRLRKGMIAEVKNLHPVRSLARAKGASLQDPGKATSNGVHEKNGVSWKRLESFGLEYRWVARFLQQKISREEMIEKLQKDIEHYAKRQMTWFKRDKRIHWIENESEAQTLIKDFLK